LKAYEQQDPYQLFIDSLKSKDILGRVYEYFLGRFADARGKKGGQFYTPRSIVKLLIEMLEPYKGRIFDPCCSSGGMFVQSEKFIKAHGGKIGGISIFWLLINFLIINFGRIL
jgi:type I restriction enzyme M protein